MKSKMGVAYDLKVADLEKSTFQVEEELQGVNWLSVSQGVAEDTFDMISGSVTVSVPLTLFV